MPTNLSTSKSKVDKLDVDRLVPVTVDLTKVRDVVKNDVVKKDTYNANIKNIECEMPDITKLATNVTIIPKINKVKKEKPSITTLATTAVLTADEDKIPNLVKKLNITKKIMKLKIKLLLIMVMINILLLKNLIS